MLENLTYYILILGVGLILAAITLVLSQIKIIKKKVIKKVKSVKNAF